MKNNIRIICAIFLCVIIGMSSHISYAASHTYEAKTILNTTVKYVTLDMDHSAIKPMVVMANGKVCSSQALSDMAKSVNAISAINGTYFEAYNGSPVPWGTIIKDGKVIHIGQGGAVMGITADNQFLVDRLNISLVGYANDNVAVYPWRINHPSTESEAITIFTPEYGSLVKLQNGAQAVLIQNGVVSNILSTAFTVPVNGFAIVYNEGAVSGVDRFQIGDAAHYEQTLTPTYTKASQWEDVVAGLGAGPSLIINGKVTANGQEEGFTEAKINTNRAGRSFIGATQSGKIIIGNMGAKTLTESAAICKSLNLVNAMCLDGGGSIGLYDRDAKVSMQGRNINNCLVFLSSTAANAGNKADLTAKPTKSKVMIDGMSYAFEAYSIENNNYFKLRDFAAAFNESDKQFEVTFNAEKNSIELLLERPYTKVGGELTSPKQFANQLAKKSLSKLYLNGEEHSITAYNIKENNFYKLRDMAKLLDFSVEWNASTNEIVIDTTKGYVE